RASAMMCCNIARATPWRRRAERVRIDLISPWVGESAFSAPQPSNSPLDQAVQNVMSDPRSAARSSAWTLSGGESSYMLRRCSASNARISGPAWSSVRISINVSSRELRSGERVLPAVDTSDIIGSAMRIELPLGKSGLKHLGYARGTVTRDQQRKSHGRIASADPLLVRALRRQRRLEHVRA